MSKRAPYQYGEDLSGKKYWKSLSEFEDTPEFRAAAEREFPADHSVLDPVSRRSFMKLAGASAGLAGLVACRRPEEKIVPYARAPEHLIPGNAEYYATAFAFNGTALGLLVESHEGRPTKVEGNPKHPESLGATTTFAQALALELYDTDRSRHPTQGGSKKSWADVSVALPKLGEAAKANGGAKLAIVTEAHRSPTLAAVLDEVKAAFPQARVVRFDAFSRDNIRAGLKAALGKDVEPVHTLTGAKVIATLDADILSTETEGVRLARQFADGRKLAKPGDGMNRLYAVESAYSVTGASADHRLRIRSADVTEFAYALANELATAHGVNLGEAAGAVAAFKGDKFSTKKPWVKSLARDLAQNKGAGLVVAGRQQPAAVHALVAAINAGLDNAGKTVSYVPAFDASGDGPAGLAALTEAIAKSEVDTVIVLGGNPAFNAPRDVSFAAALKRVANSVHLSFEVNETSEASQWHLNRAHDLEGWSDVRALDGTLSVVQPLIAPIFEGRTDAEVLTHLLGNPRKAHDLVKATWQKVLTADFDKSWRRALHEGVVPGSAFAAEAGTVNLAEVQKLVAATAPAKADGVEVTFHPDFHAWDGRFANNGWLQELPDAISKLTWDNGAVLSFQTAKKLGVADGEYVSVTLPGGGAVKLPAIVVPGQADDSVAIQVGQGRTRVGIVGEEVGFNTFGLRSAASYWVVQGAQVQKAGGRHEVARTQEHHSMEGRPLVRETTLGKFNEDPEFAKKMVKHPPLLSLFPDREYNGHKWGMVIDLNACTGCGVCMISCQAENNIPLVGKWGVMTSREMHWIRVDRYFAGAQDDPREDPEVVFQPVPCQQCELAPCEQVCPVAATTHSPEGLNDMAYNRCVGTRYCANNCPYKVRRFNFHNYSKDFSSVKKQMNVGQFFKKDYQELRRLQFNPNVTVRERGVMEKCTYCVQRINVAKIELKREGRTEMKDGEVVSACQQACPTGAIHFGDLNLKGSDAEQSASNPRNYAILAELNTRPRTTYLAKVRNPNRELEA